MSTPLSSFSVLAPAEEVQRRKEEALRDRQQTLEKLRQREREGKVAQERAAAALDSHAPFKPRNSEEQNLLAVPRTPHASWPVLPIRLDRRSPENVSPVTHPQPGLAYDGPEQSIGDDDDDD